MSIERHATPPRAGEGSSTEASFDNAIDAFASLQLDPLEEEDQVEPLSEDLLFAEPLLHEFTDEELISVLHALDDDNETERLDPVDQEEEEELIINALDYLPCLSSSIGSDDDDPHSESGDILLAPIEDLDHLFHDNDKDLDLSHNVDEPDLPADSKDALELLEQLGNLTLGNNNNNPFDDPVDFDAVDGNGPLSAVFRPDDNTNNDELPPYLYCQPCSPAATPGLCLCCTDGGACANDWNLPQPKSPLGVMDANDVDYEYLLDAYLAASGDLPPLAQPPRQEKPPAVRPTALPAARQLAQAFGVALSENKTDPNAGDDKQDKDSTMKKQTLKKPSSTERQCLGHKERILGLDLSECGSYLATASQDSTVRVWKVSTNRLLATLTQHSQRHECLRVAWAASWNDTPCSFKHVLATGGADGWVHLHGCDDPSEEWTLLASLDHSTLSHFAPSQEEEDKPQIYSLQFVENWRVAATEDGTGHSVLLTSSDDHVHLWDMDAQKKAKSSEEASISRSSSYKFHLREVMSIQFRDLHQEGYGVSVGQVSGVSNGLPPTTTTTRTTAPATSSGHDPPDSQAYGGARNPHNLIYVFDAAYCAANALLGVALSDGSLRILNGRGVCLTILQLPGVNSHLTSFCWDASGSRLATCVATGHVVTWGLGGEGGASCTAILEGGHDVGRPLFGTRYWGSSSHQEEDLLLSWGVDGRLCLWDAKSQGEISEPLAVLVEKTDYPIYATEVCPSKGVIAVGGGGNEGGFVGIPVYLYDVPETDTRENQSQRRLKG